DLDALPGGTPAGVRRVLRRCLERDKAGRYRDIGDVRLDLMGAVGESERASGATRVGIGVLPAVFLMVLIGIVAGLGGSIAGSKQAARDSLEARPLHVGVAIGPIDNLSQSGSLDISPDGRLIAYVGHGLDEDDTSGPNRIHLIDTHSGERRALHGTEFATGVTFSPSGEQIGFGYVNTDTGLQEVRRLSLSGGVPVTVFTDPRGREYFINACFWIDEDTIVVKSQDELTIFAVDVSSGALTPLIDLDQGDGWFGSGLSGTIGSRYVLLNRFKPTETGIIAGAFALDVTTGDLHHIADRCGVPIYLESGHMLFVRGQQTLCVARFDAETLTLDQHFTPLIDNLYSPNAFALSRRGHLILARDYLPGAEPLGNRLMRIDRQGNEFPLHERARQFGGRLSLSPDGTRVALVELPSSSAPSTMTFDLSAGRVLPVPLDTSLNASESWMPDGRLSLINFVSSTSYHLVAVDLFGGRPIEPLLPEEDGEGIQRSSTFTPDASFMAFEYLPNEEGRHDGVYVVDLRASPEEREAIPLVASEEYNEEAPAFSPDGKWLAYTSDARGLSMVHVRAFDSERPGASQRVFDVTLNGGSFPVWRDDGSELFFLDLAYNLNAVPVTYENGIAFGEARIVLRQGQMPVADTFGSQRFIAMPGGEEFIYVKPEMVEKQVHTLELKLGWLPEVIAGLEPRAE
ncbi:MAG: hypothetical protein ACF8GE_05165, partial [Phycisphaerales bacterium JB043]